MKKYIYIALLISIVALSCKKEHTSTPVDNGKLYPVNFTVSAFTQTQEPVTNSTGQHVMATDTPLKALMQRLFYRLYKPDGTLIKSRRDTRYTDASFGRVKDSLAAGDYVAVFLGHNGTASAYNVYGTDANDWFTYRSEFYPMAVGIYYKKVSFSVSAGNTNTQTIGLERVNAAFSLLIKDQIPAGVNRIVVTHIDYNGFKVFKNQPVLDWDFNNPPETGTITHEYEAGVTAGKNNTLINLSKVILNTETPIDITIKAYNGTILTTQKTILGVRFYRNTQTILSGNLFTNEPSGVNNGFNISFNKSFATDSITKTF